MDSLTREIEIIQNPVLGAVLLWRFSVGYQANSTPKNLNFQLLFIVLPMLFSDDINMLIKSTQQKTGLRGFIGKFSDPKFSKTDLVDTLHIRMIEMKKLSLFSLRIAISTNLLRIDISDAYLFPCSKTEPRVGVSDSIKALMRNAEKLGSWCSELTIFEIENILKLRF